MRLKSLLLLCTGAIAAVFAVLASRLAFLELQDYRDSQSGEIGVKLVTAALAALEKVSLERAPSNGLLGDPQPGHAETRASLARARTESDLAISRLQSLLEAESADGHRLASRHLATAATQLQAGRSSVDALARRPLQERRPEAIRAAVEGMIQVVIDLEPVVIDLRSEAERADPSLSSLLSGAYLAAILREQAGQVGSLITASLATRRRLDDFELEGLARLRGRIEVLHELLIQRIQQSIDHPGVTAAAARMESDFFGTGIEFIQRTINRGKETGDYGLTTSEFAGRYVPRMDSILDLRDLFLSVARDQAGAARIQAGKFLLAVATAYVLLLAILAFLLLRLGRRVIHAFATATGIVVAIADGRLETKVPAPVREDEIGEMLRSIQILKEGMIKRRQMEMALRSSEEQLRSAAEVSSRLAAIVESSEDAIVGKTLDGIVTSWNSGAEGLYGYTSAEAIGLPVSILVPPGCEDDTVMILDRIRRGELVEHYETVRRRKDSALVHVSLGVSPIKDSAGKVIGASAIARDISERKRAEEERERLISELQDALSRVKTLSGLIPICSSCKKIRDDRGYWNQIEIYLQEHSEAEFSHGICPDCAQKLYPEFWSEISKDKKR